MSNRFTLLFGNSQFGSLFIFLTLFCYSSVPFWFGFILILFEGNGFCGVAQAGLKVKFLPQPLGMDYIIGCGLYCSAWLLNGHDTY